MESIESAAAEAIGKGWTLSQMTPRWAVLTYPGVPRIDSIRHLVLLVFTLLTCGIALPFWLAAWWRSDYSYVPAQTLILTDTGIGIKRQVVAS